MLTIVTCPECQERFESETGAEISCPRCRHTFAAKRRDPYTEGITEKPSAVGQSREVDLDEPIDPLKRPASPRSPFPWTALMILTIGVLCFLLIFSAGFNVWFVMNPDNQFLRRDQFRVAEQQAIQARIVAEQAAEQARQREQAQMERARQIEIELERQRERVRELERALKK